MYRYLFADLVTRVIDMELDLTGVTFTAALNASGDFRGHISGAGLPPGFADHCIPGRTALFVDRDGHIAWGGIVWSRVWRSARQTLEFSAKEMESYYDRRRIVGAQTFTEHEQFALAKTLLDACHATGSIGITVPTFADSGRYVTKEYRANELKPIREAIAELARSELGFDFAITHAYNDDRTTIVSTWELSPQRGRVWYERDLDALMLEMPGNVVEYDWPEDGASVANVMFGVGAGAGEEQLIVPVSIPMEGWPRLESSLSLTDFKEAPLLTSLTTSRLLMVAEPVVVARVVSDANSSPQPGTFGVGDQVRLRITDDRWPDTLDLVMRVSRYTVTPGDVGPARITWELF